MNTKSIIGATVVFVFVLILIIKQYILSKEHFGEKLTTHKVDNDDLPYDIQEYKTYFREDNCIAAIRIHAFKVKDISTWSEYNLSKFDKKNFNVSNNNPIDKISFIKHDKKLFKEKFENLHKPCIITNMADSWNATKLWSFEYLNDIYGNCKFQINSEKELKFKYWYHYATHPKHRLDDDPIYIFDQRFKDRFDTSSLSEDYEIPSWFDEDELAILPKFQRPPYAWLIIGIPRSGASLHKDPLGTHAWNTLICGKKRWVLFPPDTKFGENDTNLKGHNWFNVVLPKFKKYKHYDFIQDQGDTIFLPANWWHITLVIKDSICVTQNYVGKSNQKICKDIMMKERPKVYKFWMMKKNITIPKEEKFIREDVFDSTDSELDDDEDYEDYEDDN